MNKYYRRYLGMKKVERVMRIWKQRDNYVYRGDKDKEKEILTKERQLLYATRKPCSCIGCGNRRKSEGKTRQEKIHSIELELMP